MKVKVSVTQLCPTLCDPMDCSHQAPLSMEFSSQEYWGWLPCSPPGYLSNPGIEPSYLTSLALADVFFTTGATWEAHIYILYICVCIHIYMYIIYMCVYYIILCILYTLYMYIHLYIYGLPYWLVGKESACQCRKRRFNPWIRKNPQRRK